MFLVKNELLHCTLNKSTLGGRILDIFIVVLTKRAKRDLLKVPGYIARKLQSWVDNIECDGLNEVRKIPGYHDEPLKGERSGQRSIKLNKAYRAIYMIDENSGVEIVEVLEVNKHAY